MAAAKKTAPKKPAKKTPEPQELLLEELREIYSAEKQVQRFMPRALKAIETDAVRERLERRQEEGQRLTEDLDRVFEEMDASPGRKKNTAVEGLLADFQEHIQEIERGPALDAVLIGGVQKLEHYCIAAWGTVKAWGALLGNDTLVQSMERAIEEGKRYDDDLTRLAVEEVNPMMLEEGGEEVDDEDEAPRSRARKSDGEGARA
jgi:ferritin-like metal-binding protein YciE